MAQTPLVPRLSRWLGFASSDGEGMPEAVPRADGAARSDPQRLAGERVLGEIAEFILHHKLPVTSLTLAAAFECVSGTDRAFAGLVAEKLDSGEPLTRAWIEDVKSETARDESKAMAELMRKLERTIGEFTKTTRDARSATTDYRTALRGHVDELNEVSKAGAVISELATVARAMLERTQEIEQQMLRSERETKSLQRRLDEARRNAEMDHLTGLPNRRAFETMLASEYAAAKRSRDALCVAFCDIDKFKLINDTHGHDAGDRVLKVVAQTLNEISDERCHVARHGGEEFVVLFRGKTLREAFDRLDDTRDVLANRRLVNRATDTPFGRVTFSAGLADVFAHSDPRAALKAADEALYLAKQQGRNQIVVATAESAIKAA